MLSRQSTRSYVAADEFPVKALKNQGLREGAKRAVIPPLHPQIYLTNKCNLNCEFCSCKKRDKSLAISLHDIIKILAKLHALGAEAITFSGGGEPLLYSHLPAVFDECVHRKIKIGLVTNGLALHTVLPETLSKATWCRISNHDGRMLKGEYRRLLAKTVTAVNIDWAFSHVLSPMPNIDEIIRIIEFAHEHKFTHVRLVSDLLQPEQVPMSKVKIELAHRGVDTKGVIFQQRNRPERGGECYICYLKPVISPNARVYACCGAQYARPQPDEDLPDELCLGSALDIDYIIANSKVPFNGLQCARCYYGDYNSILKHFLKDLDHKEFI